MAQRLGMYDCEGCLCIIERHRIDVCLLVLLRQKQRCLAMLGAMNA